ncbi:MAG: response regulator [Chitinophagia bacterium]|nr:response regulator [Chitinophagia bacterium]
MSQKKKYIFLVDDEPIQNEMLKDYISERYDYECRTYESGETALKDIGLNPSIVVLDYHLNAHLPDAQDGLEVLKAVKSACPGTHVIMLSGQDKIEVAVDSMKYGAYDYVIKGETAFARMENVINNIVEIQNIKDLNKMLRSTIVLLSAIIVATAGVIVWLAKTLTGGKSL